MARAGKKPVAVAVAVAVAVPVPVPVAEPTPTASLSALAPGEYFVHQGHDYQLAYLDPDRGMAGIVLQTRVQIPIGEGKFREHMYGIERLELPCSVQVELPRP